jgi:hypothetical protein
MGVGIHQEDRMGCETERLDASFAKGEATKMRAGATSARLRALTVEEAATLSDGQAWAREAYTSFIHRTTALLFPLGERSLDQAGTGLILATTHGTPFLLTARHLVEKSRDCAVAAVMAPVLGHLPLKNVGEATFLGPRRRGSPDSEHEHIDVAAIALTRAAREMLAGAPGASIATDSTGDETSLIAVAGFPSGYTKVDVVHAQRTIYVGVTPLLYVTGINGRDQYGRLEVEWDKGTSIWGLPDDLRFDVSPDRTFPLCTPHGVSGGGVWRIRGPRRKTEGVWAPSTHCELIGVASAVLGKVELAEPVELWTDWLNQVEREIDCRSGLARQRSR